MVIIPGVCTVVIVVVVIRVVVVSSSAGGDVTPLPKPDWAARGAADEVTAVVRIPGDIIVEVSSDSLMDGTAWVGLVVVPVSLDHRLKDYM